MGKNINKDNKLHPITTEHKLKLNLKKDPYKNKIELKLGKVHKKTSFSTPQDNVLNFGILCARRNKAIVEKRAVSHEIVNTVHILEFQNFNDSSSLNPVEIAINSNKIIKTLTSFKKYKFRFVIDSPLLQICKTLLT